MRRRFKCLTLWIAAVAAALVAGCAAPPPETLASRSPAVGRLAMTSWPSVGPTRAVILGLHGFGDSGALAFAGAGPYWASRGIAVHAPDQRGFGANASRKRWPGPEALAGDAVELARRLRARHPGAPLIVVGESMGGGVALLAAARGLDADALVLTGPAIAGGTALSPLLRAGAWTLAAMAPERRWTGGRLLRLRPTDNVAAMQAALADPRFFSDPSSRELYGLVRLMDLAAAAAPEVGTPVWTLMGAHDEVLSPERVRTVQAAIPGGAGFTVYPEGWHWLLRDLGAPRVWRDVADFALSGDYAAR